MPHFLSLTGRPPSWNEVVTMVLGLPTYFGFFRIVAARSAAEKIFGSLNGMVWLTHWSYTSGPWSRRTMSSIQSVAGQPVASPDSMPAHHAWMPLAAILSERAIISSHVFGTV